MVDSIVEAGSPVDWDFLRTEGLKHLQEMTGHLWTDYNIHDPGITLFEALCYGIEILESRISQDISTLLTNDKGQLASRFFSPAEILTVNPVTINDYRKLLIDIPGVKNAWLEPATDTDPDIYHDKDNNALLYDYASNAEKIHLNGLYRVHIEKEETVYSAKEIASQKLKPDDVLTEEALRIQVKEKLHAYRNLGEDFEEIRIMEQEVVSLFTDIQIEENADANDVMGRIYYDLKNFISPRVPQYGLKKMLKKGKTIEQIYNGPTLSNGFIDDDELGIGQKRRELHTSDLIKIIMAHREVKDVRNLFISNKPLPEEIDKKEWALVLDDTKALVLEKFNVSRIRLFKHETLVDIHRSKVLDKIERLASAAQAEISGNAEITTLPTALTLVDLTDYEAITRQLPSNFGISETGLPSSASLKRRAQAKQLKGYLLFFEQILVNFLKQLDSFKHVFSLNQDRETILKTYFSERLPESLWNPDFPEIGSEINKVYEYLEDDPQPGLYENENAFARKNRILNHLLALFNEKFADYSVFGYKVVNSDDDSNMPCFLNVKGDLLRNYPTISRNRNRAYNALKANDVSLNSHGLKELIAAKVGFDAHVVNPEDKNEYDNFHIVEHILLRPHGTLSLDFICSERIRESYQPDPYSYKLTFIIPKGLGRFQNAAFKNLVYTTIEEEIPAHFTYQVLEFNRTELTAFAGLFASYLEALRTIRNAESDQYNLYRNQLLEMLGVGKIKLPMVHLDATDFNGDGIPDYDSDLDDDSDDPVYPADGSPVSSWFDLSRNNHHATGVNGASATFVKNDPEPPFIKFDGAKQFEITDKVIQNSFTIVMVFNASVPSGNDEEVFPLISGFVTAEYSNFSVGVRGDGTIIARVKNESVALNSTIDSTHIVILSGDKASGELHLTIDGEYYQPGSCTTWDLPLNHQKILIGANNAKLTCRFGELVVLDSVLSGSRKRKLEEYLSKKWRIVLSVVHSIEKPLLHLDANHLTSVSSDIGTGKIERWEDLSESRVDAIQEWEPSRPVYNQSGLSSRPAVQLSGSHSLVINTNNGPLLGNTFTIAFVYRTEKSEGQLLRGVITDTATESTAFQIGIGKMGAIQVAAGDETLVFTSSAKAPHILLLTGDVNSNRLDLYLDGKSSTYKLFANATAFASGSKLLIIGEQFMGEIGEIIFFDKVFTVLERQRLEDFLSRKWKIDTTGVNPVTKPVVHLDAARLTTIKEDANGITRWDDISPYQNHALQPVEQRRPTYDPMGLNQKGAVKFTQIQKDASDFYDDSLNIKRTIQEDFTIFVVFRPDATHYSGGDSDLPQDVDESTQWTKGAAIIDADCSGTFNDFGISIGKKDGKMIVMAGIGDRMTRDHTIQTRELSFQHITLITLSRLKSSGKVHLYANGLLHTSADLADNAILNDARKIKIGAFNSEGIPFRGHIGEVIILDHVLSDIKRQQIERYLSSKWSVAIQRLPIDTTNLWLHFDANERDTVIMDKNYVVSHWEDTDNLSQLAASQESPNHQPQYIPNSINNMPAIRFNNSYLAINDTPGTGSQYTIAIVFNALSWGNSHPNWNYGAALMDNYHIDGTTISGFGISTTHSTGTGPMLTTRVGSKTSSGAFTPQTPHIAIISGDADAGETRLYIDGIEATTFLDLQNNVNLSASDKLTIGAANAFLGEESQGYFHGDISEIVYIKRVDPDQEVRTLKRQALEKHLSQKWHVDISGINSIAVPLLHLDASKPSTIIRNPDTNALEKWLDKNGHEYAATQTSVEWQPMFISASQGRLPVVHFEKGFLTLPQMVQNDFTVIVVFKADSDLNTDEYMPVSRDAFMDLAGVDLMTSVAIWQIVKNAGYIDNQGNVLPAFTPHEEGFVLNLGSVDFTTIRGLMESYIIAVLTEYRNLVLPVPKEKFITIGGINRELSVQIWTQLKDLNHLDQYGLVNSIFASGDFDDNLDEAIRSAIINIIMADNWFEGVGLIDGNAPGDQLEVYKRDFGILIADHNKIIGGVGVIGKTDSKVVGEATKDEFHVVTMTRSKNSGLVTLTVDDDDAKTSNIARGLTMEDSQQLTIGAVNTGGNYFKGDIGEIIILDKELAPDDVKSIQQYLAEKWKVGQ